MKVYIKDNAEDEYDAIWTLAYEAKNSLVKMRDSDQEAKEYTKAGVVRVKHSVRYMALCFAISEIIIERRVKRYEAFMDRVPINLYESDIDRIIRQIVDEGIKIEEYDWDSLVIDEQLDADLEKHKVSLAFNSAFGL